MRKVTFAGTRVGLVWSTHTVGVIISDRLIAEVPSSALLGPDGTLDPVLATAAAEGCRFVVQHAADPDPDTMRQLAENAAAVDARCLSLTFEVPALGSAQLETLIEQLRTTQDIVALPIALDPVFDPEQSPAQNAQVVREIAERSWCTYVLDLSSISQHAVAHGVEPDRMASDLPPDRVAFVRVRSTTRNPVSSTVKDLMLSTMSRWEAHPPSVVLSSTRPVSASLRELAELVAVSGHDLTDTEWSNLDMAVRAATSDRAS